MQIPTTVKCPGCSDRKNMPPGVWTLDVALRVTRKPPLRAEGAAGDRSEELRLGQGNLLQCQASGCARGWRCTVRSLLCRPRLASSLPPS